MYVVSFVYRWSFRNAVEPSLPFLEIFEARTVLTVYQPSNTAHSQGVVGDDNKDLGSMTRQVNNAGMQSVKWSDNTEKYSEDEYPYEELPEP